MARLQYRPNYDRLASMVFQYVTGQVGATSEDDFNLWLSMRERIVAADVSIIEMASIDELAAIAYPDYR